MVDLIMDDVFSSFPIISIVPNIFENRDLESLLQLLVPP
jgi:hypothetical protein